MQIKDVVSLSVISTALRAVGALTDLYLLARLGGTGTARASLVTSVCSFFSVVASSGVSLGMTRLCAEARALHKEKELSGIRSAGASYAMIFGGVSMIALFLLAPPLSHMLEPTQSDVAAALKGAMRIWAPGMLLLALSASYHGYLVGTEHATEAALSGALGQLLRAALLFLHLSRDICFPSGALLRIATCGVCGELASTLALYLCAHKTTPKRT